MKKIKIILLTCIIMAVIATFAILPGCAAETTGETSAPETVVVTETVVVEKTVEVEKELTPVRIGVAPYSMFVLFMASKEVGFDKEIGLDFKIDEFTSTAPAVKAMLSGDIDIASNCINEAVPYIKTAPQVKTVLPLGFFKGFIFIGRKGEFKPWDELVAEMGLEKAKEFRLNEFKGKGILGIPFRFSLVNDAIGQVGLTEKDYIAKTYADDQLAATAFINGDGDIYTGSLVQEMRMLKEMGDKFINLGGQEILGPMGLWYDTLVSTEKYVTENKEALLKTMAVEFRTIRAWDEDTMKIAPIMRKNINRLTGAEYSDEEYIELQTVYDDFQSMKDCKEALFNPESPLYAKIATDYNIKAAADAGTIDKVVPSEDYFWWEDIFKEFLTRNDLIEYVDSSFKW